MRPNDLIEFFGRRQISGRQDRQVDIQTSRKNFHKHVNYVSNDNYAQNIMQQHMFICLFHYPYCLCLLMYLTFRIQFPSRITESLDLRRQYLVWWYWSYCMLSSDVDRMKICEENVEWMMVWKLLMRSGNSAFDDDPLGSIPECVMKIFLKFKTEIRKNKNRTKILIYSTYMIP